jgi:hypothetical protein
VIIIIIESNQYPYQFYVWNVVFSPFSQEIIAMNELVCFPHGHQSYLLG